MSTYTDAGFSHGGRRAARAAGRPVGGLSCVSQESVGWVEQTGAPVGLRSRENGGTADKRSVGRRSVSVPHQASRDLDLPYRQRCGPTARRRPAGFTLVEVMTVVVIMAILAAILVPRYHTSSKEAQQRAFVADVQVFAQAARRYMLETGDYLEDAATGVCPSSFEPYVDLDEWKSPTPIGGRWDFEYESMGVKSAFGVHFDGTAGSPPDDAYMAEIDRMFDDGALASGRFRKLADGRYYFVLEDL
jgi:general secretion pathway protein G